MLTEADDWPYANWLESQRHDDTENSFADLDNIQPAESVDPEELQLEDLLPFDKDDMMVIDYDETIRKNSGRRFTALNAKMAPKVAPKVAVDDSIEPQQDSPFAAVPTQQELAPATTQTPVGYAAFRQTQSDGTKKKGRPKGWKKSIHGKAAMPQKQSELDSFFPIKKKTVPEALTSEPEDELDVPPSNSIGKEHDMESHQDQLVEDEIKIKPIGTGSEAIIADLSPAPATTQSVPMAVGYSAFRQTQVGPDGKVAKKKGRPIGWRKSLHSRAAQGLPSASKKNKKKSEKVLVDDILEDIIKVEAPESTFQLKVEEDDSTKNVAPEDESDSIKIELGEHDEQQQQQPNTSFNLASKNNDEEPMTPLFWSQVVAHASQAEASSSALEQGETIERKDSVMGDLVSMDKQEISSADAIRDVVESIESAVVQKIRSAATEVFSNYELLERIFLSMPKSDACEERDAMQTILLAQRVSKTFQYVIQRSVKLQQELFFKPTATPEKHGIQASPFKLQQELSFKPIATPEKHGIQVNPLLGYSTRGSRGHPRRFQGKFVTLSTDSCQLHAFFADRHDASTEDGASSLATTTESWRRMLLCRGIPVKETLLLLAYEESGSFWNPTDGGKVPATVTMGRVMDIVQKSRNARSKSGGG